ncbi:MAG: M16 family metallopeptidase [Candidatus Limnocylindrales bacterium]
MQRVDVVPALIGGRMPGIPPSFPVVRFAERRLANGLRVIVAPDHLAPVVAINVWYDVGSKHEAPGRTGFAHLFEHLMFQGSRHVGKAEHLAIVQAAGGVVNGTTYFDRTNYFETLPSHRLELGLWLEADRMATLLDAVTQENLDNQRDVVKNEKRQSYDNRPYGSFYERLLGAVMPSGHPYQHTPIGSMADLDAASLEDVRSFFRTYYAPDNAVLAIAGDVEPEEGLAAAATYFDPIPPGPGVPPLGDLSLPPHIGREVRQRIPDRVPFARVHLGYRTPPFGTPAFDALEVATQIAAGGQGSRLYRKLVRELRIAQDVALFLLPLVEGASVLTGWATVRPESDAATVEAVMCEELARLAAEPVTDDEMARARALIESEELAALGRIEEVADRLAMYATLFDRPGMINEQLARYLAVDAAAICRVMTEVVRPDNLAVLTYVPEVAGTREEAA